MKSPRYLIFSLLTLFLCFAISAEAQKRRIPNSKAGTGSHAQKTPDIGKTGIVIEENLAVLRQKPSLFSESLQRMRRGRKVLILDSKEADGIKFYKVSAPPNKIGWVQSDAVFGSFRQGDDERLVKLIQASKGFEQLEIAAQFLEHFPASALRPAVLLLFGDLAEETAVKLSRDASRKFDRKVMAATGAPLHSFYLNYVSLDRYRKIGIAYLFDPTARSFHYEGKTWKQLLREFPASAEAAEARKRLDALEAKLNRT